MSGTLGNLYNNISFALRIHSEDMIRLQEQVASGSQINRMSDAPDLAHHVLTLKSQVTSFKNYRSNLADLIDTFEFTSSTMGSMTNELTEVKRLVTQISAGIYGEENRERIADGIEDHLEQLVQLANSKHVNQFIFGGAKTNTIPYTITRDTSGKIQSVNYQGSAEARTIQTAPGVNTKSFFVGSNIFGSNSRETPVFSVENSGATLGSGTPNVTGDVWLTVTQVGSDYFVAANGGTAINVTTAADPTNMGIQDENGKWLYIDTTTITNTGTDLLRMPGTYNVFDTLLSIRSILDNTRNLATHNVQQALQDSIASITEITEHVLQKQVSIGLTTGFLYDLQDTLETQETNASQEADTLEQADIAQIAIDLSRRQVLYEMSLSVAGKLMSVTLLDFLR